MNVNRKNEFKIEIYDYKITDFDIVREIGKGAFAKVYSATVRRTGENVALKCFETKRMNLKDRENVYREIDIHKKLSNERIIKFRGSFKEHDNIYIILDLMNNGNLFKHINKKTLSDFQKRRIYLQVCEGLDYLHSKGFLMRDLKPENILLDNNMDIKLCDFGWSCSVNLIKDCHQKAGTYAYMSPESLLGKFQSYSTDMWSLGILLYEMYFGKEPYEGQSCSEQMKEIKEKTLTFPPGFDYRAKNIIVGLLQKDPKKRFTLSFVKKKK